jgi:hypothetical protein
LRFPDVVFHGEHAVAFISEVGGGARGAGREAFWAYVVCRRYWSINLKEVKKLGTAQGGKYVDGIRFTYEGGQIRSLLSLLSYFGKGEMRERSLGIKIPPTNLKPDFDDQAQAFANQLADSLDGTRTTTEGTSA